MGDAAPVRPQVSAAALSEAIHIAARYDGHGRHGGLTADPATDLIICRRCGKLERIGQQPDLQVQIRRQHDGLIRR